MRALVSARYMSDVDWTLTWALASCPTANDYLALSDTIAVVLRLIVKKSFLDVNFPKNMGWELIGWELQAYLNRFKVMEKNEKFMSVKISIKIVKRCPF